MTKVIKYLFFIWVGFTSIVGSLYLIIEGTRIFGGEQTSTEPYRGTVMASLPMRNGMTTYRRVVETPSSAVAIEEPNAYVSKQAADNANNAASGSSQNSSNENVANPPASSTPPTNTPDQQVASALGNIAPENAELDNFLNKVKTELAKDGLTFAKVKELYKEYEKKFKNVQLTSDQKKIEAKLNAYNEVVGVLSLTDKEKFKQEMRKLAPNSGAVRNLNKKHREWFLAIRWGDYRVNPPKKYLDENVDKPQVDDNGRAVAGKYSTYHGAEGMLNFYITNKNRFTNFKSLEAFWAKRNYDDN